MMATQVLAQTEADTSKVQLNEVVVGRQTDDRLTALSL